MTQNTNTSLINWKLQKVPNQEDYKFFETLLENSLLYILMLSVINILRSLKRSRQETKSKIVKSQIICNIFKILIISLQIISDIRL